jgi:hypothetical protein
MIEPTLNHMEVKPPARCVECDRETDHYITFTSPTNEQQNICWLCYERSEKGFNTKRDWKRTARQKQIETMTNQGTPNPPSGAQH